MPGQYGLNAGVIPDAGFTYSNMAVNYSATQLNGADGNPRPGTGQYGFWVDENIFVYVPNHKILGGYFDPYIVLSFANGSLVAERAFQNLPLPPVRASVTASTGFADIFVQPVGIGWHLSRLDANVGYSFTAPTGRYTAGSVDNIGSGYWGHNITTASTYYITKNKGTSANLATVWEIHGQKKGTGITPGQAFTMEWGLGQVIPLKKDLSHLMQVGIVGYDQWQVSNNGGRIINSLLPYYSAHALGMQINYIMLQKGWYVFFKYEPEYRALAHPQGRAIVFGFAYTLRIPKAEPQKN